MRLILPTLLIAMLPTAVSAQRQIALVVPVEVVQKLDVSPASGTVVVDDGFAERHDAVVMRVTANVDWRIEVSAVTGELQVRSEGEFEEVSAGWQTVASGGRGGNQEIVLDLRRSGTAAPDADDVRVRIVTK